MISKDTSPLEVYGSEFVIDNGHLGFVATDSERNLCIFVYSPESKESMGGQRLIRKADIYIGKPQTIEGFTIVSDPGTDSHWIRICFRWAPGSGFAFGMRIRIQKE
jgi:cleavage and polyadenylation specificity factor subunit 1